MRVEDIHVHYETRQGPIRAVDGVSFDLKDGEVLGVVGESGCGKSTLAAALAGSGPPNLKIGGGTIEMNDHQKVDLAKLGGTPREWRGDIISLLPQRALNALNPTQRIGHYAYDVIHAHKPQVHRKEAIEIASDRLDQLGLPPRVLAAYPHELSGGMRQRVVTVISTLLNPTVLIADEPTSALDVSSQKALILMLRRMIEEDIISRVIFISHDLALMTNIADRVAVMYAGEIVEEGSVGQVVGNPEHPYSKALIGSTLEPDLHQRGIQIKGLLGSSPDMRNPPPACRFHPRCDYCMEICTQQEPPKVGTDGRYAMCWWVKDKVEGRHVKEEDRVTAEHIATTS